MTTETAVAYFKAVSWHLMTKKKRTLAMISDLRPEILNPDFQYGAGSVVVAASVVVVVVK
jgi:hypothetical protein